MAAETESNSAYRAARRAFVAACTAAGVDAIARVHPRRAPDGKPLFQDSAALGPRHAKKALLVVARDMTACAELTRLLEDGVILPDDARLVLMHAFDPFSLAWGKDGAPGWTAAMLAAVAAQDLSHATALTVAGLDDIAPLRAALPGTKIAMADAKADIRALLAAL